MTVTEVRLTDDLRSALVYVSIIGEETKRQESLKGLGAAAGFLKRELSHRLKLRFTPDISFALDTTLDHALRLEQLLGAAARGDKEAPAPDVLVALPAAQTGREMPPAPPPPPPSERKSSKSRRQKARRSQKLKRL